MSWSRIEDNLKISSEMYTMFNPETIFYSKLSMFFLEYKEEDVETCKQVYNNVCKQILVKEINPRWDSFFNIFIW